MVEENADTSPDQQDEAYNVVFVVGAGASKPFGYPVGSEFLPMLYSALPKLGAKPETMLSGAIMRHWSQSMAADARDTLPLLWELLGYPPRSYPVERVVHEWSKALMETCRSFIAANAPSIDTFVAARGDRVTEHCAKIIIAEMLAKANFECKDRRCGSPETRTAKNDGRAWIDCILHAAWRANATGDGAASSRVIPPKCVAFVTFNYDTVIESEIERIAKSLYGRFDHERVDATLARVPVYHVYGRLNYTDHFDSKDLPFSRFFSHNANVSKLDLVRFEGANAIENAGRKRIRNILRVAKHVVFLGFSFDPLNIDVLGLRTAGWASDAYQWKRQHGFASAMHEGYAARKNISRITGAVPYDAPGSYSRIGSPEEDCYQFLRNRVDESIYRIVKR